MFYNIVSMLLLIYFQLFSLIFQNFSMAENITTIISTTEELVLSTVSTYLMDSLTTLMSPSSSSNPVLIEIISIQILPKLGNSVELVWGKKNFEYNLNWTYGVYYGSDVDEALKGPKLKTTDLHTVINDLKFCSKYYFAVAILNTNNNNQLRLTSRNIQSIGTCINEKASPVNLNVEFLPGEYPCLLIKWSASCSNIISPLGYLITIYEKNPPRMLLITVPRTRNVELTHLFYVRYGSIYDIKLSTDFPKSNSTDLITFHVPYFLQPYKLRLTSESDGTFMMYWREPFVPFYIDDYFYEIYVYPGLKTTGQYEKYQTRKSVFLYKGNQSVYTFMVGLISIDGVYRSYLTNPITKSTGSTETVTIQIT